MSPYAEAISTFLHRLTDQVFATLDGVDEAILVSWRPAELGAEGNTMMGLATHTVGAGEHWLLQNAGGQVIPRDRLAEFRAESSVAALRERYDRWLRESDQILEGLDDEALASVFRREANPAQGMTAAEFTRAACVIHALEHTALHVGHLQIQRQMLDSLDRPPTF